MVSIAFHTSTILGCQVLIFFFFAVLHRDFQLSILAYLLLNYDITFPVLTSSGSVLICLIFRDL